MLKAKKDSPSHKKIAPSLLSADFSNLQKEISLVEKGGADLLHLDIMDGHFVPNLTFGPFVVKAIHHCTPLVLDCHLMLEEPEKHIESFAKAGAKMISVHCETRHTTLETLKKIKRLGAKAGIALNPDSPIKRHLSLIEQADYVLIMSVYPGFAEQKFIENCIDKIREVHSFRATQKLSFEIEVDGGIKVDNIEPLAKAGADIFVAGSAIFKSKDYQKTISEMKEHTHARDTHSCGTRAGGTHV